MTVADVMEALRNIEQTMDRTGCWHLDRADEGELPYVDMGILADHLVERFAAGSPYELDSVVAEVERLIPLAGGDAEKLIAVGLLEGIQNEAGYRAIALDIIASRLGPWTLKLWNRIIQFWEGRPYKDPCH